MQKGFCGLRLQLATLLSLFISVSAWGFGPQSIFDQDGQRLPDREVNSGRVAWELLSIRQHGEFGAMGLLSAGFFGGGCSATLIDNGGPDQSPAYIVTNGHCLMNGYPQPGEFIVTGLPPEECPLPLAIFAMLVGNGRPFKWRGLNTQQ